MATPRPASTSIFPPLETAPLLAPDINFGFDPTLLSCSSIVFGNQVDISGLGDIQSVTPGTGTVEVFELSLDSAAELNSFIGPVLRYNNEHLFAPD